MADRLTIGITGPDRGGLVAWLMTAWAVRRCGGRAIRITPSKPCDAGRLHGVIIGGGSDVDPFHYGEDAQDEEGTTASGNNTLLEWAIGLLLGLVRVLFATGATQDYDPDRDRLETSLIKHALYHELPVLGICRGAQLMNIVLGGTLHQSIEHFYSVGTGNVRSILPRKPITISPDSRLREILETDSCTVNALHDQSIKKAGDSISVSAREDTGVIQAIESRDLNYYIGVQWHPEYMPQSRRQQKLFRQLLRAAADSARGRTPPGLS